MYPLILYQLGRIKEAVQRGRECAQMGQSLSDTFTATFGHPHLGMALAAIGRYSEAARVFDEARQLALKHEVWPFLARGIAISAGFHLDTYDYCGNEVLAEEARERANFAGFRPSVVSACLDLLFNFTRRHEIGRAENLIGETEKAIVETGDWHRWLWQSRLAQVRAELSLARGQWRDALELAEQSIGLSRKSGRVKYIVAGGQAKSLALAALGRKHEAISELGKALDLARPVGDPAMLLRVITALLLMAGEDTLLAEARVLASQIIAELPTPEMRQRFEAAEPVRLLGSLEK
jgi:tetratricopeptide (TPR) repeat protein